MLFNLDTEENARRVAQAISRGTKNDVYLYLDLAAQISGEKQPYIVSDSNLSVKLIAVFSGGEEK